jgi:RDD family
MGGPAASVPPALPAGLARRLAATVYESLILGTLALVLGFLLLPVLDPMGIPPATGRLALLSPAASITSFVAIFVLYAGYCAWLSSGGRRTLPMQTWHLALRTTEGAQPSPMRVLGRYLAWWIGPACAIGAYLVLRPLGHGRWALAALTINYAWALIDADRQFLHDRIGGTRLVRV